MAKQIPQRGDFRNIEWIAKLMDSQFGIPGTKFRFGLDGIIGLIPGAGDLSTFAISAYLLTIMARNGASGYVLARMVLNVLIDALFGSIPILGDLFDIFFQANMRNLKLMQEHYVEGRHKGGAWKVVVPVLLLLFLVIAGIIWGTYELLARVM
jgi:NADH:ubiquinone oxidoreductase subunit 5 (subunit L)/multisubunit Na+/H+ antiporter MnhA subunit